MFTQLLQQAFSSLSLFNSTQQAGTSCHATLEQAVEHVVDETFSRLRVLPGYEERLRAPVQTAFFYIDQLVEGIPEAILCCRASYGSDARVNAFFANVQQLCDLFSRSQEVRDVFEQHPLAEECWGLLCMHKEERQGFGMALMGDEVRKEVMQTRVNFTDHALLSPGVDEEDARRSLKCCVFSSLLGFIRREANSATEYTVDLENQRRSLLTRRRSSDGASADIDARLAQIEAELAARELPLDTLDARLSFVADVLGNPSNYISSASFTMRLNRMGVKLSNIASESGSLVPMTEIRVARHAPRIATLVRFPRAELLPTPDYLQQADRFLAV